MPASISSSTLEKFTTFGDLLRYLRRRAGLTQLELSFDVGYSDAQISRLEQNLRLPDLPTIEERFIPVLGIKNEPVVVARLLELAANVRREDAPALGLCPYKGLSYFDEADADLFVGREALTAKLTECVLSLTSSREAGKVRFFAIVGASGSGKSSLVRAGLVPALRWNKLSANWPIHVLTPAAHPLESLAMSLTLDSGSLAATAALMDDLTGDRRSLDLFIKRDLKTTGSSYLLLVIDQFEELFALCRSEDERCLFIDNLLTASSEMDGKAIVIIALRADFYAYCAGYPQLREAIARQQEYIGALNDEELRRAIEEPARRGRWEFESGLVDLILYDVGHEPGALPLLSHALLETWQRRHGRTLTLSGYTSSGGVRGAIAETAEALFVDQFTPEQQAIARRIFLRLTELGDETATGDTRRRARFNELILRPEEAAATQTVLKALADARLITTGEDSAQVAHEALIREWPTLRGWLEDNREGLRLHRHLTEGTQEWLASNHEPDMLYHGARLAQANEWAASHGEDMNTQELEFLAASVAFTEKEVAEREAQRQRELEAAHRLAESERQQAETQALSANKLRRGAIFLALALCFSIVLLIFAIWLGQLANRNARTAQEQTRLATSRELAAASVNNLQVDPERSVLLALQALATAHTLESSNALHQSLPELHILHTIPAHLQTPGLALSPDGSRLVSIGINGEAKIWDASTYQLLLTLPGDPGDIGNNVDFSPDGKLVAVSTLKKATIWDAASGQKLYSLVGDASGPQLSYIRFSPDGKYLAVANMDGLPKVWDLASREVVFSLAGHAQLCDGIAYSPDSKRLATSDEAGVAKTWDTKTGQELVTFNQGSLLHSLAFSPDGARLALAGEDGTIKIWDSITGKELVALPRQSGIYTLAFMPDGLRLVAAHQDGSVDVWDSLSGIKLLSLAGHISTVLGTAVSPDGDRIMTSGYDGTIKIWDAAPGSEVQTLAGHTGGVFDVAYSPTGSQLATAGQDGTIIIWDGETYSKLATLAPEGQSSEVTRLVFSSDGKYLASGNWVGEIRIWDLATRHIVWQQAAHAAQIYGIAFSSDDQRLASTSWDGSVKVWDIKAGKEIVRISDLGINSLFDVALSQDGKQLITSNFNNQGYVYLWDAYTGKEVQKLAGAGQDVYGIAISPDGRLLAIGWENGFINIWDLSSGKKLQEYSAHAGLIVHLAFSKDGTRLASASFDKFAKVWEVQTGQELATLYGNTSNVFGVSFSPDGTHVATAGGDGTTHIYTLELDDLINLARSRLTRSLTGEECRKYLHMEQCPITQ